MRHKIKIDKQIPLPVYYQLKEALRKIIKTDFKPGDKFFSERELAEDASTTRITAGRALNDLVQEGLLYRIQGQGSFVANVKEVHLIKKKTCNIGYILGQGRFNALKGAFNWDDLNLIGEICRKHNYNLVFSLSENEVRSNKNIAEIIKNVDGMILSGEMSSELINFLNKETHIVLQDHEEENIASVMIDNYNGVYKSTEYLIKLGHKNIGIIHGNLAARSFVSRLQGWKDAMTAHGISFNSSDIVEGGPRLADGYAAAQKLLEKSSRITAIVAANDIMAIGAMKAVRDKGLRIPEDISIIGFDGIEMTEFTGPPLSTVRFDNEKMAEIAVEILLGKIAGTTNNKKHLLPVKLVKRESCAACSRDNGRS